MGGAAMLLASLAAPRETGFRSMVLFEPIVLPPHADETLLNPLTASALRRRGAWSSTEEAHAYLAARSAFRRFDPRAAAAYARGGTRPALDDGSDGVVLACDPQDEAAIYRGGPRRLRERLHEVGCPCHVVSGELSAPPMHSDYFRRLAQAARSPTPPPAGPVPAEGGEGADGKEEGGGWGWEEMAGAGHFLVMENPRAAAAAIAAAAGRAGFGHCFRAQGAGAGCGP
jgi:pimeloyl-ACP methyl ester carboxylesterase